MQENNQNKASNGKSDLAKNIGSKVASGAMQASGVPKPLADVASKAATNFIGGNPMKGIGGMPGITPRSLNNGLRSAKNTNPTSSMNNKIGKGSHPSQTPGAPGNNSGGQDQNKLSNLGKPSSLGDKPGLTKDEGSNGGTREKSASDSLKEGAKNLMGLGGPKPSDDAPASIQIAFKLKRFAKILEIITPILPFIFFFVLVLIVPFFVMAQVMIVRDKINDAAIAVTTGIEKFVNFTTTGAWETQKEEFFSTLDTKYKEVLNEPSKDGSTLYLDIPLIAATINYSKVSDVDVYETGNNQNLGEQEDGSAEGIVGNFFESYMKTKQMRNFYYVANDKLGNYKSLIPGNRRLLGHMINYEIQWGTYDIVTAAQMWITFFGFFAEAINNDVEELLHIKAGFLDYVTGVVGVKAIFGAIKMLNTMKAYDSLGVTHDSYFEYHARNILYEWEELIYKCRQFLNSDVDTNHNEDEFEESKGPFEFFPAPSVVYYETTDMDKIYEYGDYLRRVYIPGTFYSNVNNYNPATTNTMVREIYQQKKYYIYLVGDLANPGSSGNNCNASCTYNLSKVNTGNSKMSPGDDYQNMGNIKVKLVAWYNKSKRGQTMAEGIDFENYILGVTYAEVGETFPEEALKSEAVAARSYALTRPFAMGNQSYCNYKKEGDGWILTLRGSTADQVYCDPDQGCSSDNKTTVENKDIYPGLGHGKDYKQPLEKTPDKGAKIRAAVSSTSGQVLVDGDGNVTLAEYIDTDQTKWKTRANNGEKYTTIIPSHYTSKYGHKISLGDGNCTKMSTDECSGGAAASGEWANWRQMDASWGSIKLGNSDIYHIGCAATAIAIQLARSGAAVTFSNLNPGTFVTAYKKVGGFTGGSIYFDKVSSVAPDFKYAGRTSLSGSKATKAAKIKEYLDKGYYIVMEVKKGNHSGQHWVAVLSVNGENVKMADPASSETDVSTKYTSAGWSEFVYYKKS